SSAAYDVQQLGAATAIHYDALGREVGRTLPLGTSTRSIYRAWSVEQADANDTVATSPYRAMRAGLPADAPERQALEHALRHAGTTSFVYLDAGGRSIGALDRGGTTAPDRGSST